MEGNLIHECSENELPQVLVDLILDYLQLLYDGQYKWSDLKSIPDGTYTFMLNIKIVLDWSNSNANFSHKGDVNVIYDETVSRFMFKFNIGEFYYELVKGTIYDDRMIIFRMYDDYNFIGVTVVPENQN